MTEEKQNDQEFIERCSQRRLIRRKQYEECIRLRDKAIKEGAHVTFAQIAVSQGYLSKTQAEEIYREIESERKPPMKIGGFEIIEKVGSGGMGTVFKARQLSMNRVVALKVLPPKLTKNKSFLARFQREAMAAARLNHPNIVHGIDAGVYEGFYYFAMEFVDGESLGDIIERQAPLPEAQALKITREIALALEHASEFGIVHRDIKPGNILITRKGTAKLSDLGLAKVQQKDKSFITHAGLAVGTPHYISPEQAQGKREVDVRSDIYSLGVSLYHMLTGNVPFPDDSPLVVMTKHLNEVFPPVLEKVTNVSRKTLQILDKMVAKRLRERYQAASEIVSDIDDALAGLEGGDSSPVKYADEVTVSGITNSLLESSASQELPAEADATAPFAHKARENNTHEAFAPSGSSHAKPGQSSVSEGRERLSSKKTGYHSTIEKLRTKYKTKAQQESVREKKREGRRIGSILTAFEQHFDGIVSHFEEWKKVVSESNYGSMVFLIVTFLLFFLVLLLILY